MKILGIETSCDETSAAIVEDGTKILSNVVSSSQEMHKKTGGIIPEEAAREQIKCMIPVLNEALELQSYKATKQKSKIVQSISSSLANVDAIAVTVGPGLIGSLLVGVETAKTIAFVTGKPIIPVNHIFAHLYANFLSLGNHYNNIYYHSNIPFPAIALIVSGGHTELFLLKSHKDWKWLGGTRDDAAGEAFDKTARLLGLGYPGGPAIAAAAEKYISSHPELVSGSQEIPNQVRNDVKLPRPMMDEDNLDFSFSGLKTAVLREVNKLKAMKSRREVGIHEAVSYSPPAGGSQTASGQLSNQAIEQIAYEIQEAITDVLVDKTLKAAQKYKVKSILLGGGVAANKRLTEKFKLKIENLKLSRRLRDPAEAGKISLHIPPPSLCTDNAASIASYAYFHNHPVPWQSIQAQPDLEVEV